jgi:LmbE family N-acetylglucosaminyl deacetylase
MTKGEINFTLFFLFDASNPSMKKIYLSAAFAFLSIFSKAQTNVTSADIYLGLRKLNTLGSVLYIAAHPDDENTRLITYLSKDRLYRTGYLSLTRGDGGQNLIGDEQGIELGLIRTQELLAARRIDGGEQFFTRAYDFGFSKNPEETFQKWNKEKVLADVVWVIRRFQPDVIITRFPTTGEGGHGHHTASAILANEAFTAAADPKRFPEQLQYTQPWQAKRILWNTFNFGSTNTTNSDQFKFDVGGYNAILGKSYGEIAADSRSQHKSQGFGVPRTRGEAMEFFRTTGGEAPVNDLMDGITANWQRVQGGSKVEQEIAALIQSYDFLHPEKSVPALVQLYQSLMQLPPSVWSRQKMKEVELLIEQASGLFVEASTGTQNAVQGDSLRVNFMLNNRSGSNIVLQRMSLEGMDTTIASPLPSNKNFAFAKTLAVFPDKAISQPYWLRDAKEEGFFTVKDQQKIGQPDVDPAFVVNVHLRIEGQDFFFRKPVQYKLTDPVKGELYKPVFVVKPVTVYTTPEIVLFQKDKPTEKTLEATAIANRSLSAAQLAATMSSGKFSKTEKAAKPTMAKNEQRSFAFTIRSADTVLVPDRSLLSPTVQFTEGKEDQSVYLATTTIQYDHIPTIRYFYRDNTKLLNIDLKTNGRRIGYIVGAGDKVPDALEQMGYEVVLLTEKEMARNNFGQFDAIIAGVRAYNTNEWMNNYYDKLMKYVEGGGNLIVQYNTSNQIGPVRAKIGPYNFNISRNRITDENAPVSFLKQEHPVLNYPNKITQDDFKGWVQERSIYHATATDVSFQSILRMNDPGENGDDGALIIAPYGKGFFTYTGLVFFRQLPAGVPGAYRLLANLIALNRKKEM